MERMIVNNQSYVEMGISRDKEHILYHQTDKKKGRWMAENIVTGKVIPITYHQAHGFKPITDSVVENSENKKTNKARKEEKIMMQTLTKTELVWIRSLLEQAVVDDSEAMEETHNAVAHRLLNMHKENCASVLDKISNVLQAGSKRIAIQ